MRLLVLTVLLSCAATAQTDSLAAKSQQAKQLMGAGRFAEAALLYEELVKALPGNVGLVLNLGMAQHMGGRDREAIVQFERVLKLQPKALPALMLMGTAYMRLGEPAKAVPPLRRGLALSPGDKQAQAMLIDALLMLDRFEEAAPELEKAVAAASSDARGWYGLGRAYEALAQRSFEKLRKVAPDSAYLMVLVGETQLSRGRNSSAFQLFREAIRKDPNVRGANAGLANVYRKSNHADWAATADARERKLPPAPCEQRPWECHFAAGRLRLTVTSARKAATPDSLFWLTRAYGKLAADAFATLERLPPSPELHQIKAEVYRNQGRHADSAREWEAALKLDPANAQLKRELATTIYLGRDYARAEPLLREQLRAHPGAAELHFFIGDILLEQQKHEEAIAELRRAVELEPRLLLAQSALGRALAQSGKPAEALPHLEAARAVDTDGSIHYQLARAYQAAGKADQARQALARYQELSKAAGVGTDGVEAEITAP